MACVKTALLLLCVYFCGNGFEVEASCAEHNIDYPGHDFKSVKSVMTWGTCAQLCHLNKACHYWTWVNNKFRVRAVRYKCYLKRASAGKNRKTIGNLVSGTSRCIASCAEHNIDYPGHDFSSVKGVSTWGACAKLCAANKACHYWTWVNNKFRVAAVRHKCYLKRASAGKNRKTIGNLVSGTSRCIASCAEHNIDYPGHDFSSVKGVSTWGACAKLCAANKACHYWTWVNNKFRVAAVRHKCYLKRAIAGKNRKTYGNLVSGISKCTEAANGRATGWVWSTLFDKEIRL